MEMGDFNYSLSRREGNLIIFAEASGMVEPGEGTFDHPSPRELFPLMRFDFFRNINVKAELTLRIRNKSATISSICTELLDRRIPPIPSFRSKYPTFCVMNIGSMNHNRQQAGSGTSTTMCRFLPFVFSLRQFPLTPCAVAHSLIQWCYLFPLFIGQVAGIRLSFLFFHVSILSQTYSLVNTGF